MQSESIWSVWKHLCHCLWKIFQLWRHIAQSVSWLHKVPGPAVPLPSLAFIDIKQSRKMVRADGEDWPLCLHSRRKWDFFLRTALGSFLIQVWIHVSCSVFDEVSWGLWEDVSQLLLEPEPYVWSGPDILPLCQRFINQFLLPDDDKPSMPPLSEWL